jgi:hypothetical protein
MSKHWHDAADCYSLALDWCPDDDSEKDNKAVYYCNRAACHLKLEEYDQTVEDCTLALEMKVNACVLINCNVLAVRNMRTASIANACTTALLYESEFSKACTGAAIVL